MAQNIYSFLLSLGSTPETIQRIMEQMKPGGNKLFENRSVGMRGNPSGLSPVSSRPSYATRTPPGA